MKPETINQAHNPLLPLSMVALKRAANKARELAARTHTALIIAQDKKTIRQDPDCIREDIV